MTPSVPYHTSAVIFIIPPEPATIPRLLKPFTKPVWALLLLILAGNAVIIFLILKIYPNQKNLIIGLEVHHPVFNMIQVALSAGVNRVPKTNFARFCLISWVILCFFINNGYLAIYFKFLTQNPQFLLADTFDKIAQLNYTIYVRPGFEVFFENNPKLQKNIKVLDLKDYPEIERKMQNPTTKAVLLHTLDFVLHKNKFNYTEKPLITAPQHVMDMQIAIYFPQDTCIRQAFDPWLRDIASNGMISHWVQQYIDMRYLRTDMSITKKDEGQVITNAHLKEVYCLAAYGYVLALLVFCLELLSLKFKIIRKVLDFFQ